MSAEYKPLTVLGGNMMFCPSHSYERNVDLREFNFGTNLGLDP